MFNRRTQSSTGEAKVLPEQDKRLIKPAPLRHACAAEQEVVCAVECRKNPLHGLFIHRLTSLSHHLHHFPTQFLDDLIVIHVAGIDRLAERDPDRYGPRKRFVRRKHFERPVDRRWYDRHIQFLRNDPDAFLELLDLAVEGAGAFGEHAEDPAAAQDMRGQLERAGKFRLHVHGDHLDHLRDPGSDEAAEIFSVAEKEGPGADAPGYRGPDKRRVGIACMIGRDHIRPFRGQVLDALSGHSPVEHVQHSKEYLYRVFADSADRARVKHEGTPGFFRRFLAEDLGPRQLDAFACHGRSRTEQFLDLEHHVPYGQHLGAEGVRQADAERLFEVYDELHPGERVQAQVELKVVVGRYRFLRREGVDAAQDLPSRITRQQRPVCFLHRLFRLCAALQIQVPHHGPSQLAQARDRERVFEYLEAHDPLVRRKVFGKMFYSIGNGFAGAGDVHPAKIIKIRHHGGFQATLSLEQTDLFDGWYLFVEFLELFGKYLLPRGEHDHFLGSAGDKVITVPVAI